MTELRQIGDLSPKAGSSQGYRVYDPSGLCPSLEANGGGYGVLTVDGGEMEEPKIKVLGEMEGFESANRVYDAGALAPALRTYQGGGLQPKVLEKEPTLLGGLGERKSNGGTQDYQQDRVFSSEGVAPAHPAQIPGGSYKFAVASRGRGEGWRQNLEVNETGNSNALTTARKDNMVLERNGFFEQAVETAAREGAEDGDIVDAFNGRVNKSGVSPTITTRPEGKKTAVLPVVKGELDGWRIRKLTPRECYRLMGVKDSDVDKIQSVISKSQQYKTAGNSIVSSVLCALFLQLNIQGIKSWNDRTEEERRQFWDLRGR